MKKKESKDRIVRIVIPADDDVANAFLDRHGQQRSGPLRTLMHMFVAEHGDVDVMSVAGRMMSAAGHRRTGQAPSVDDGETVGGAPEKNTDTTVAAASADASTPAKPVAEPAADVEAAPEPPADAGANVTVADDGDDDDDFDMDDLMASARGN